MAGFDGNSLHLWVLCCTYPTKLKFHFENFQGPEGIMQTGAPNLGEYVAYGSGISSEDCNLMWLKGLFFFFFFFCPFFFYSVYWVRYVRTSFVVK